MKGAELDVPSFTAHNIGLDDGALTKPEAGETIDRHPWFLAAKRILDASCQAFVDADALRSTARCALDLAVCALCRPTGVSGGGVDVEVTARHWLRPRFLGPWDGTVALRALEIGVPERLRAKSARLRLPPATYYASARSQSCLSDPKFRYRPRPHGTSTPPRGD